MFGNDDLGTNEYGGMKTWIGNLVSGVARYMPSILAFGTGLFKPKVSDFKESGGSAGITNLKDTKKPKIFN